MRTLAVVPVVVALVVTVGLAACDSPEAVRTRGGDPGADIGNRGTPVRMHEGSRPYHDIPRLLSGQPPLLPARQASEVAPP